MSEIWKLSALKLGESLAKEQDIITLPVDPISIAENLDILIEPLPSDKKGVSGMLIEADNNFGIMYATYLDNIGFQNFCIGHELGHIHLPGHYEQLLNAGYHHSTAGFTSNEKYEIEADHFSAGLLMPSYLFDKELNKVQSGLKAVETLARKCNVSLTAAAIRYAQRTPDPIAIVISEENKILYCFMSSELRDIKELSWIKKNSLLSKNTITFHFNQTPQNILNCKRDEGSSTLLDWFQCLKEYELYEEVIGLGKYGKTLTVLSIESIPDQEEIDEEEELEDSWAIKFKR